MQSVLLYEAGQRRMLQEAETVLQVTRMSVREAVTDVEVGKKTLKRRGDGHLSLLPRERTKGLSGAALWDAVDKFAAKLGAKDRVRVREREEQ